ncbi:MAG: diguanylate cyclase [Gemmatimonadales bacterium]|jgi:diguanylate cyclase (GGDEF)-like protein
MRVSQEAITIRSVTDTDAPQPRDLDPRTGLPWVHAAEGPLASWFSTNRWNRKCSVVKFGIDGFERFAGSHDDEEVDLALFIVGLVLKSHAQRNYLVGRCQSGEFIVLLPDVGVRRAVSFSKRVSWDVASQFGHNGTAITLSSGVASQDGSIKQLQQLLELADSALRAAKWQGGNRFAVGSVAGQSRWLPQRSWLEAVRFVRSA